jgi:ABC-type branched-subunit amino acid transport system substrate-binding protein
MNALSKHGHRPVRRRTVGVAVVIATSALTLAACGGSDSASSSAGDGPIKLFQIAPLESQVYSAVEMAPSAQAAVDRVNDAGGVNGRKLELISCNDKYDPSEALRCAKKAVQEDAVAVIGSLSAFGDQTGPVLAAKNIPNIGANGLVPSDYTSKLSYLLDPGVAAYTAAPVLLARNAGATKLASFAVENPSNDVTDSYFRAGAKVAGVDLVKEIHVPADAIDWVSYVKQAESAGANGIVTSLTPEGTLKLWNALESAQLVKKLPISITATSVGQSVVDKVSRKTSSNTYGIFEAPSIASDAPWVTDYLADMKKGAPDITPTPVGLRAWMSVQFTADVMKGIDGDVTSDTLVAALNQVHDKDFMWIKGVSFDEPGKVKDLPRMFVTTVGTSKIVDGQYTDTGELDAFAP